MKKKERQKAIMGKGGGGVVRSEWESKGWGEETTSISEMGGVCQKS